MVNLEMVNLELATELVRKFNYQSAKRWLDSNLFLSKSNYEYLWNFIEENQRLKKAFELV